MQTFKTFQYDPETVLPDVGQERQEVTLVLASADGCKIIARR
jgi:hypothetical protein